MRMKRPAAKPGDLVILHDDTNATITSRLWNPESNRWLYNVAWMAGGQYCGAEVYDCEFEKGRLEPQEAGF